MAGFPLILESAINAAAAKYGVDPQAMRVIAQIESGGRLDAKNPKSSAGGPFQFIDSTARAYGLQNRFDAGQASDAAARLLRDNAASLRDALGREPSTGELYLAHQQGAGGARKLLTNPNARAADIVGEAAVRLNGGSPNMTAGEFANLWVSKAGGTKPSFGLGGAVPGEEITEVAEPVEIEPTRDERFSMLLGQMVAPKGPSPLEVYASVTGIEVPPNVALDYLGQRLTPQQRADLEDDLENGLVRFPEAILQMLERSRKNQRRKGR